MILVSVEFLSPIQQLSHIALLLDDITVLQDYWLKKRKKSFLNCQPFQYLNKWLLELLQYSQRAKWKCKLKWVAFGVSLKTAVWNTWRDSPTCLIMRSLFLCRTPQCLSLKCGVSALRQWHSFVMRAFNFSENFIVFSLKELVLEKCSSPYAIRIDTEEIVSWDPVENLLWLKTWLISKSTGSLC